MQEMGREISADYQAIRSRVAEDPGTAGERAEETWASLLRDWLPPSMPVVTRGRILSSQGVTSPQVDVLVLHPDYPKRLQQKKVFLSDGVMAAFECKLTLKPKHVVEAFDLAQRIDALEDRRRGRPLKELRSRIFVGLLAHSHSWTGDRLGPLSKAIGRGLEVAGHPASVLDIITIADFGSAICHKLAWVGDALLNPDPHLAHGVDFAKFPSSGAIQTQYLLFGNADPGMSPSVSDQLGPQVGTLGTLMTELLGSLEGSVLSDFFQRVDLQGSGSLLPSRLWPATVLSRRAMRYAVKDAQVGPHAY